MLTPVDLQQKKFQHGMGYTKKDVDSFFDIVILSYTELYKSNAELTNQVKTLTDSLVHYRTTESKLQKSLMLAEKNAEEATKNANDKAKIIENDAKIKANNIVHQAREELERIEDSIEGIKQQYRDYTMAFKNLMDSHLQFLATNPINEELGVDFDEIMKDAKYFNGNAAAYAPAGSAERVVLNSRSKYLLISRVLVPRAYMLMIWSAIPSARMVSRFLTVSGLKEPSRSRGVSTVTSPYFVCTVLLILPLRRLPELQSTLLR